MLPVFLAVLGALFLLAPILVVVPMSFSTAISFAFPPPGYWLGYYAKYFTSEERPDPRPSNLGAPPRARAPPTLPLRPPASPPPPPPLPRPPPPTLPILPPLL